MAPWTGDLGATLAAQGEKFDGNPCTATDAAESASKIGARRHPNAARLVSKALLTSRSEPHLGQEHGLESKDASISYTPRRDTF